MKRVVLKPDSKQQESDYEVYSPFHSISVERLEMTSGLGAIVM